MTSKNTNNEATPMTTLNELFNARRSVEMYSVKAVPSGFIIILADDSDNVIMALALEEQAEKLAKLLNDSFALGAASLEFSIQREAEDFFKSLEDEIAIEEAATHCGAIH
jgi:hypothetical protein